MQRQSIHSLKTGQILYEGLFETFKDCVESAVRDNACLKYADFKNRNLSFINMDDIKIENACFEEANLTGANISECEIRHTSFLNTTLHGACFAQTHITDCDFRGSFFGGTNIDGVRFKHCNFDTLSSLNLNFKLAYKIDRCTFHEDTNKLASFSMPPIKISGLDYPIIVFDETVKIGPLLINFKDIERFQYHSNIRLIPGSGRVYNFATKNKKLIQNCIEQRQMNDKAWEMAGKNKQAGMSS